MIYPYHVKRLLGRLGAGPLVAGMAWAVMALGGCGNNLADPAPGRTAVTATLISLCEGYYEAYQIEAGLIASAGDRANGWDFENELASRTSECFPLDHAAVEAICIRCRREMVEQVYGR